MALAEDKILLYSGVLGLFIFLESILPNFTERKNPFTRKYFIGDMLFLIMSMILGGALTYYSIKFLAFLRQDVGLFHGFEFIRNLSWEAQFGLSFVVRDFLAYWMHRFTHSHWIWKFHLAHHESDYLDAAMAFRVHPVNFLFNISRSFLLLAFGFNISILPAQSMIMNIHNIFVHTNIRLDFGFMNYVFISPYLHRIHHAASSKLHHFNYGVIFSVWDQIFGTFINEKLDFELGVEGHQRKNFALTLLEPFLSSRFKTKIQVSKSKNEPNKAA